jgi:hypothetical protein
VELSAIDKNANPNLEVDRLSETIADECRMTIKEFWLSEHGIYLFLCFWTSILIIGKTNLIFPLFFIQILSFRCFSKSAKYI